MTTMAFNSENGDYLWDSSKQLLIKYDVKGSSVIGYARNFNLGVATPIPLNEDILDAIGFSKNEKAGYSNGNITIDIDGCNSKESLVCDGKPVHYVSDIQQICRKKGQELQIDEAMLIETCEKYFFPK